MSDVPYGAFLSGGGRLRRDRRGDGRARAGAAHAPSRSASPATATCSTSAARRPRRARLIGTSHHEHGDGGDRTSSPSSRARCPGSRSPAASRARRRCSSSRASPPSDVKVVLAGQGADEPHGGYGRHQAAALLHGRCGSVPAAAAAPAAALARALPRAASARRVAHLLGGRGARRAPARGCGDHRRARARRAARRRPRRAGRHRAPARRARRARRRARPRPPRAGALPRHAHVPAGRDPALQRQDVDGRRPRAAGAVPRRRADALRRAHPGAPRACARAPASASTARRWSGSSRPGSPTGRKHGFATPYDDWLRASLGEEVERRYAPARRARGARRSRRGGPARRGAPRAAGPTTRASCSACSSSRSGTAPSWRRGSRCRRDEADPLRPQQQRELRPDRPGDPRRALRDRGPPPARQGAQPAASDRWRGARRPRVRLVGLLAHLPAVHARLALAQAVGADRRRVRHREHAGDRLRLPDRGPAPAREPLDHAPRSAARRPSRTSAWARSSATPRSRRRA